MTLDFYIDEKDKELGRARLSQVGEGASAGRLLASTLKDVLVRILGTILKSW